MSLIFQMDKRLFAQRLKQARNKRGLTQRELAQLCGFEGSLVSRYESESREPSVSTLLKLSEVLNLSMEYLVGLTSDPFSYIGTTDLDPNERELVDIYRDEGWPGVFRLGSERIAK